jgi:hypothetical protein
MAKVTFHIFTLFPEWFETPLKVSIIGRAIKEGHIAVFCHNIRDYATDKHRTVDDYPYGGGAGSGRCYVSAGTAGRVAFARRQLPSPLADGC